MKKMILAISLLGLSITGFCETIKVTQNVPAYDIQDSTKQIGTFNIGTALEIDRSSPRSDGLLLATFKPPQGEPIQALCRSSELFLGLEQKNQPAASEAFGKSDLFSKIKSSLVDNEARTATKEKLERLRQSKYVLVYFSAHWCPPCRKFTPEFVSFYNKHAAKNTDFETIFVSSDQDGSAMKEYMKETKMPWLAVSYGSSRSSPLNKLCGAGIPCLVLLDENGKVLSDSYKGEEYVGPHVPLKELEKRLQSKT